MSVLFRKNTVGWISHSASTIFSRHGGCTGLSTLQKRDIVPAWKYIDRFIVGATSVAKHLLIARSGKQQLTLLAGSLRHE